MATYRLYADEHGRTHLEPLDLLDRPYENGPGDFKGIGGSVLGDASRVMLMRFESAGRTPPHRAVPSLAVLLEGELVIEASDETSVLLRPGDAVRVETTGRGGWRLGNREGSTALLAIAQMPPARGAPVEDAADGADTIGEG